MIEFYDSLDEEVEAAIKQSDEYFAQERKRKQEEIERQQEERKRKIQQGICLECDGEIKTYSLGRFGLTFRGCENECENDGVPEANEERTYPPPPNPNNYEVTSEWFQDFNAWMKEQTDEY